MGRLLIHPPILTRIIRIPVTIVAKFMVAVAGRRFEIRPKPRKWEHNPRHLPILPPHLLLLPITMMTPIGQKFLHPVML